MTLAARATRPVPISWGPLFRPVRTPQPLSRCCPPAPAFPDILTLWTAAAAAAVMGICAVGPARILRALRLCPNPTTPCEAALLSPCSEGQTEAQRPVARPRPPRCTGPGLNPGRPQGLRAGPGQLQAAQLPPRRLLVGATVSSPLVFCLPR